jgi:hypothetical protein
MFKKIKENALGLRSSSPREQGACMLSGGRDKELGPRTCR